MTFVLSGDQIENLTRWKDSLKTEIAKQDEEEEKAGA